MKVFKLYRVSYYGNLKIDLRCQLISDKVFRSEKACLDYYKALFIEHQIAFEFIKPIVQDYDGIPHSYYPEGDYDKIANTAGFCGRYDILEEELM